MTPDKQNLISNPNVFDMIVSGGTGLATSVLHKIKSGKKLTAKNIIIDALLAVCSMFAAYIICGIFSFESNVSRAVYFGAGWLGSRVIARIDKRSDEIIDRGLDVLEERIKA